MNQQDILGILQNHNLDMPGQTWQRNPNVHVEIYCALASSGMLSKISGNALKVLVAMGLRAQVLGSHPQGEALFRHLIALRLVTQQDCGQLFCYATQQDLLQECGFGSRHTLIEAINCLIEHNLIEKRSRYRRRRSDNKSFIANVYFIRPLSGIRKFNTGYTPTDDPLANKAAASDSPAAAADLVGVQKMHTHQQKRDSVWNLFCALSGQTRLLTPDEQQDLDCLIVDNIPFDLIEQTMRRCFETRRYADGSPTLTDCIRSIRRCWKKRDANACAVVTPGLTRQTTVSAGTVTTDSVAADTTDANSAEAILDRAQDAASVAMNVDPMKRVKELLQAVSQEKACYTHPGILVGLQQFLTGPRPFSPDEVYDAVLAAVSRGGAVPPERLVSYVKAVLENKRRSDSENERMTQAVARSRKVEASRSPDPPTDEPDEPFVDKNDGQEGEYRKQDSRWCVAMTELEMQFTRVAFDRWLKPAHLLAWDNDRVTIGVSDEYAKEWLESRWRVPIERTLTGIAGRPTAFQCVVAA